MTATYDDYRRAVEQLRSLPAETASDLEQAQNARTKADSLADQAVTAADAFTAGTRTAIETQLADARSALEPLGKATLVPRTMRPSGGVSRATRQDVAIAQQDLVAAVEVLRQAALSEARRLAEQKSARAQEEAERERLARLAAERAAVAAARRARLTRLTGVSALSLLILVLILVLA